MLAVLILFSVAAKILYSDKTAIAGTKYFDLNTEIASIERENELLRADYLSSASLMKILEKARELGYTDSSVEYYKAPGLASR